MTGTAEFGVLFWEFAGAIGVLVPFALLQFGRTSAHAWVYLVLNLLGSAVLTAVAVAQQQWGFVILQAVWALVAAVGIVRRMVWPRPVPQSPSGPPRSGGN